MYNEGDDPKRIYLVRSGEVIFTKKIMVPRPKDESDECFLDENNFVNVVGKAPI